MKIKTLFSRIPSSVAHAQECDIDICNITSDSRQVEQGSLFVAIAGTELDGHDYIDEAISRGAVCVIGERDVPKKNVPYIRVSDARAAEAYLDASFFDTPSKDVKTVGITGTNGKTTITFLIAHILRRFSRTGFLSTICYDTGKEVINATHTTPPAFVINKNIARMRDNGCSYCVMEVSSHALSQKRVAGLDFDAAIFTNLTQDHLDYHETVEKYFEAKKILFTACKPRCAIVNADDPFGRRLIETCPQASLITYGIDNKADVRATDIHNDLDGLSFVVAYAGKQVCVKSTLVCQHNIYNILAACAYVFSCGFDRETVAEAIRDFPGVKGRLERIDCGQPFTVFVDYAHTPDAFSNVLRSVREMSSGRIISVFGCGGNRDRSKRPQMGRLAAEYSDHVFITNDNPRNEPEMTIIRDIESGMKCVPQCPHEVILDRRKAIWAALGEAGAGDCVLLLGKGHEEYIIKEEKKSHFSDRECAEEYLQARVHATVKKGHVC